MPNRRQPVGRHHSGGHTHDKPAVVHSNTKTRTSAAPARRIAARRGNRLNALVLTIVVILLASAGGYAGYFYRTSAAMRSYWPGIVRGANVASTFPGVHAMNLMIIGRDADYNDQDQLLKSGARSDILMVAHVDFEARTAQLLSIPRDTAALIPGHGVTKINAAHEYGGPALTAQTIQTNFGNPVDHYIALDFDGFKQAIDLLGGVDCTVDKKMDYDDNWGHLHIHLLPGYQHLDGEHAMDFVRFRHSDSDLIRIQRQQELLAQLKRKLVQPMTLAILPTLLDTVDKHVSSDMNPDQKLALAKFLHGLPQQNVQMTTLPSIESPRLVQTDYAKSAPIIKQIFAVDEPAPIQVGADRIRPHHNRHRRQRVES